jgi:hypothetical protein
MKNVRKCFGTYERLRRGRDSNPRYPFEVYTLSRRALSTTQTPLLLLSWKRYNSCKC